MFTHILRVKSVLFLTSVLALAQSGGLEFTGSYRTRLEAWNWFEGAGDNTYAFSGNLLRLAVGRQHAKWDWQVELAAPILLALPERAIAPAPQLQLGLGGIYFAANNRNSNAANLFPKQGFIRLKNLGSPANSLRLGRFEFLDGAEVAPKDPTLAAVKRDRISQRLIGNFGWSHAGRSYDGAHFVRNSGNTNITVMGALATRGVFQVNGWGNLKTGLAYAAVTRQRPGKTVNSEWRLFGIYYDDWRNVVKTDNRPLPLRNLDQDDIRIGTFGGHYLHSRQGSSGTVDLMAWGVFQSGKWGQLDHLAGALSLEAGWQPPVLPSIRPWLRAGFYHGSGDGDPLDGRHGTLFQILPTPRPYARTPFFNLMNNQDFFAMGVLRPHRAVTIKPEAHFMWLARREDLWYQGGGAFQPWSFGYIGRPSFGFRSLANLYDISVDWTPDPAATISAYYGHVQGRNVVRAIYPAGTRANFGYVELLLRF